MHRLMQSLPDIPEPARKVAVERYLKSAAADFTPAEHGQIAQQVIRILNDLVFAELFAPGSRAEVPIVGRLPRPDGDPILVSGQVDRLAMAGDAVLIADYKTDRRVPVRLDEVEPYVAQLALYRALLSRLYPNKTVRAALVFTAGPKLIEVSAATMEAALAEILSRARAGGHSPVKVP
jgi:ATP-dependent helicase/nuclease subunit A